MKGQIFLVCLFYCFFLDCLSPNLLRLFSGNLPAMFFNIFYSFNPNHAYWNQRRLFRCNLPGMLNRNTWRLDVTVIDRSPPKETTLMP